MLPIRDDLAGWFYEPTGAFFSLAWAEAYFGACIYRQGQRPAGLIPLFKQSEADHE